MGKVRDRRSGDEDGQATGSEAALRGRLRTLAYELTVAEARERSRIARDLHDEIGQLLAVARFKVMELRHCPAPANLAHLDELGQLLDQAARATRSATFDLQSPALELGLEEALRGLAQRLGRHSAAAFHVAGHMPAVVLPPPVLSVLYRVTRELTLNAQRHARARQISIGLDSDAQQLRITINDDGIGIPADWSQRTASPEGGFGLLSAHAQMQALGGDLVVESGPGAGTQATVSLPLEQPPC
jgi:signal transduction histidine kinase